jgi:hypothetical protein
MPRPAQALIALFLCFLAACQGTRMVADPVLEVRGVNGATELAVSTDYGLVFLGRSARSGPIEVTAWFGDGPSVEFTVVEPLGGGLFTAEPQIRLPRVPMSFEMPRAGQTLRLIGRRGKSKWSADVTVRSDKAVTGLIVDVPGALGDKQGQAGAGLYLAGPGEHDLRLVGLVTGEVEVSAPDGGTRRYLTAVGPDQLWRLVTYKRNFPRQRKFVYRADVM